MFHDFHARVFLSSQIPIRSPVARINTQSKHHSFHLPFSEPGAEGHGTRRSSHEGAVGEDQGRLRLSPLGCAFLLFTLSSILETIK